jgi:hypothetical protein
MNENENDPLWQLLGKAKQPVASPFFARNVVRAVRHQEQSRRQPWVWLRWTWRVGLTGAFAALVFGFVGPAHFKRASEPQNLITQQIVESPDYDAIKDLDELLAHEESSLWLDDSVN